MRIEKIIRLRLIICNTSGRTNINKSCNVEQIKTKAHPPYPLQLILRRGQVGWANYLEWKIIITININIRFVNVAAS